MFHRRRWVLVGVIALLAVGSWRLSFWNPHPILNAQEVGDRAHEATSKTADEQAQAERLLPAESLSQFLKKLYPDIPLQVQPVGEAVLLRGSVWSQELQKQVVEIAEQFFPKVLDQLKVDPSKRPREDPSKAGIAKPLQTGEDKSGLRTLLSKLYPTATLEVHFFTDQAVLIRGRVTRQADIQPIRQIAEQYLPKVLMDLTAADQSMTSAAKAGAEFGGFGSAATRPDLASNAQIGFPEMSRGVPATNVTPRDGQDAALDRDAKQLATRVRAAKEPEKSNLRAELETLTNQHFEQRQQRRETEIAELADRVDKLRVAHHRRQENKRDIIGRRITDLLDADKDLRWDEAHLELTDGIYFFMAAERCPPCQQMMPIVKRLQNEGHHIEIINADQSPRSAERWKIVSVPTFLILKEGKETHRIETACTYDALKRFVAEYASPAVTPTLSNPFQLGWPTVPNVEVQTLKNEFNVLTSQLAEKAKTLPKDSPEYVALEGRVAKLQVTILQAEMERLKSLIGIPPPADPEALNRVLWAILGLKLAKLESNQDLPASQRSKYRGGMRVTEVREGSHAAINKFQKGDILVGLNKWETTSFENVKYVFDQPEVRAARSIKFYVLRKSETLYGFIQWNDESLSIGQLLLNQFTKPAEPQTQPPSNGETKTPNSGDANKPNATAALIRAAEARQKLAALELNRANQSNKKVPGSMTTFEIERFKTNLEVAEAELDAAKAGVDISRSDKPKTTVDGEPTFDGTSYSQWLKMLESERKPEKLATAIEACARLAVAGDERRIARGIFLATKLFEESDDSKERNRVWDAATSALKRLPGEVVVSELIAALPDERIKKTHDFPSHFLISATASSPASEKLRLALKSKADELIATYLGLARATGDSQHLLARATSVWLISERKLSDFEGLHSSLMKAIDEVYSRTAGRINRREQPWFGATLRLAETEPETPELATLLAKHLEKDRVQIYARLSRMGRHAEVAVPRLIGTFLVIWKRRENELRAWAANERQTEVEFDATFDVESPLSNQERMVDVLNVLGAIGSGAKDAVPSLKQILLLAPPKRVGEQPSLDDKFFDTLKQTLTKIGDVPETDAKDLPPLLSEFFRLKSRWNLMSTNPEVDHKDIQFDFNYRLSIQDKHDHNNFEVVFKIMTQLEAQSSGMHFRIDDTTSPRQIDLYNEKGQRTLNGIYELSGDRLKIEIAKTGKPRPKAFSPDKDKLPEGYTLLEFERDRATESEPVP